MAMTPNVFIMSSDAGHSVAEALASILARDGRIDARTWKSGDFRNGEAFLDTLRRTTLQYDFGITVLTPDDATSVRDHAAVEPRDNVIFELGLFLGARGLLRAFPLAVTVGSVRPSIPNDLLGILIPSVTVDRLDRSRDEMISQVNRVGEGLAERILELYKRPEVTILPSTGLAIGYFQNFILPVMKGLQKNPVVHVTVDKVRDARPVRLAGAEIIICIPDDIRDATRDNWKSKADDLRLLQGEVDQSDDPELPRAYPFRVNANTESGSLRIYDTPTTLVTARHVVRRLLPDGRYDARDRAMAEEREIHNFERTLRALLDEPEHDWFSRRVSFALWSTLPADGSR